MQVSEALRLIWSKVDRPNSCCPDIEIGYVRRVLGEVMATEVESLGVFPIESDRFVLGQALIGPVYASGLADDWYESKHVYQEHPQPPNNDFEDEGYQKAIEDFFAAEDLERAQRTTEVSEAIARLKERGFLKEQISAADDPVKYHVDPVTMSALPV